MNNIKIINKLQKIISEKPYEYQAVSDLFEMARIVEQDDFDLAHSINKNLRKLVPSQVRNPELPLGARENFYHLNKKTLLFDAKIDFDAFLQYLEYDRPPDSRFYLPRRKTLWPMVQGFQEIHDGLLDLLTISQPKRTGKTTLGLMFVLFRGGLVPTGSSICSGSGNDLVKSFYNGCLDILQKPEYLYYDVFPASILAGTNADEKTIHLEKKKRFATITCRSIYGALTGSTEATPDGVLYLDDLVSDDEEANNRDRLDKLWDKTRGDLLGRRIEGCPIVAQGTRYSIYDPIGRLIEIAPTMGWRTKVISIPALDPLTDESNFEIEKNGKKIFTTAYYRSERELVTDVQWASQFQQEPYEAKGRMFPDDQLNRYFKLPVDRDPDAVIAVCDTAEGGGDSVMLPIAYIYGDDVFIEDCVFDNSPPNATKPQCAKKLFEHKVSTATFESNNAGTYYARDVEELITKLGGKVSIRTKRTISNKHTRIEMASDGIIKHFYFKDKSLYKPQDQYGRMMKELTTYTRTGKVKHDDAPDGLSLLENEIRNLTARKVEVIKRPF